ncbi:MAG: AI-2E family transporter [Dysgonamonadaceae bacterium]|nr:AI-2E family transporter [Dysgonamonadaceae bacterium]MDD4727947.1 AI-2E family transporter [Dysgonamonadaceae bacterium]
MIKINNNQYKYILIALLVLVGLIFFKEGRPFLSGILGASTLFVLMRSQMAYLTEKKKWNRALSASLLLIEALLLFLIPLTAFALLVVDTLSGIEFDIQLWFTQLEGLIDMIEDRIGYQLITLNNLAFIPKLGGTTLQFLAASTYSLILNSIVVLFILYYMLYNYKGFERGFKEILPFRDENKQILAEETKEIIRANAIGIPLLGIIQGVFALFGYMLFGIDRPVLFAILTAFSTILPVIGTMAVWIPLSIGFFISGDALTGFLFLMYGTFIIGGVDNVARFMLQKQLADIHPLITIFGVIIGLQMFGFWGVIFGPLLLSYLVLLFNMYRHDYIPGSKAKARVTTNLKTRGLPKYPINKKKQPK